MNRSIYTHMSHRPGVHTSDPGQFGPKILRHHQTGEDNSALVPICPDISALVPH